jgi:predicted AlkP superfamily pyrophosphatase or phosphodiesterase
MRVMFLIIDAFDPTRLSPRLTPNLWRWANTDGAAAGTGVSVMASCTYPNHASFVTGVGPEHHRIHTNHVIRDGGVKGAWEVGPGLPTLFDRLSHVETAAVLGDHHLVGVMGATGAARHWPPDGDVRVVEHLDLLGYPDDAAVLPRLLAEIESGAEFVLGYFGSIDTFSHVYGPSSQEATAAYRRIDQRIGEVDDILRLRWEDWVLVVVSDHVQDTVDGPGIDLRALLDGDSIVVDEGSAALVAGLLNPQVLSDIDGVEGWTLLTDGNVLAWCEVGRYFGPYESPILRGAHGGAHTREQLALVSGGHHSRRELASAVAAGPVPATYWAGGVAGAFGVRF